MSEEFFDELNFNHPQVESFKLGLTTAEADYARECWNVLLMAIKGDEVSTL